MKDIFLLFGKKTFSGTDVEFWNSKLNVAVVYRLYLFCNICRIWFLTVASILNPFWPIQLVFWFSEDFEKRSSVKHSGELWGWVLGVFHSYYNIVAVQCDKKPTYAKGLYVKFFWLNALAPSLRIEEISLYDILMDVEWIDFWKTAVRLRAHSQFYPITSYDAKNRVPCLKGYHIRMIY